MIKKVLECVVVSIGVCIVGAWKLVIFFIPILLVIAAICLGIFMDIAVGKPCFILGFLGALLVIIFQK